MQCGTAGGSDALVPTEIVLPGRATVQHASCGAGAIREKEKEKEREKESERERERARERKRERRSDIERDGERAGERERENARVPTEIVLPERAAVQHASCGAGALSLTPHSSHRNYIINGLRKSTPSHNRPLIFHFY